MSFPESFSIAQSYRDAESAADTKSERTRLRLLAVAADMLDHVPFPQLRPGDVAKRAALSRGLIYHYFEDLAELVTQVADDFTRLNAEGMARMPIDDKHFGYPEIVGYLSWILAVAVRNRGVMRLMHTQSDQLPRARAALDRFLFDVNQRLGAYTDAPHGLAFGPDERLLAGYMIGGGFNSLLRELFVHPNPRLPRFESEQALFELVQLAATLRHRQVHATDPLSEQVRAVASAFDLGFFTPCLQATARPAPQARPASMPRLRRMAAKAGSEPLA
jgi:AcrR family transcriptional regulator